MSTSTKDDIIDLDALSGIISHVFGGTPLPTVKNTDKMDMLVTLVSLYKECVEKFDRSNINEYLDQLEAYREYVAKLCYIVIAAKADGTDPVTLNLSASPTLGEINNTSDAKYKEKLTSLWSDTPLKYYYAMYKGVFNMKDTKRNNNFGVLHIMNRFCKGEKGTTYTQADFDELITTNLSSNLEVFDLLCKKNATDIKKELYETYEELMFINYASFFPGMLNLTNGGGGGGGGDHRVGTILPPPHPVLPTPPPSPTPTPKPPPGPSPGPASGPFPGPFGRCMKPEDKDGVRSRKTLLQSLLSTTFKVPEGAGTRDVVYESLTKGDTELLDKQLAIYDSYMDFGKRTDKVEDLGPDQEKILVELANIAFKYLDITTKKGEPNCPRENQLMAVLLYSRMKNLLLQASTGQGKSAIIAFLTILIKKIDPGIAIHILTTTSDLAYSGYKENEQLFKDCNVKAFLINSPEYSANTEYNCVLFGTPFDIESLSLDERKNGEFKYTNPDTVKRIVILDESDTNLIDAAYGATQMTDDDPDNEEIKKILVRIAEEAQKPGATKASLDSLNTYYQIAPYKPFNPTANLNTQAKRNAEAARKKAYDVEEAKYEAKIAELTERYTREKGKWIDNAILVFQPTPGERPKYESGTNYVVKLSLLAELASLQTREKKTAYPLMGPILQEISDLIGPTGKITLDTIAAEADFKKQQEDFKDYTTKLNNFVEKIKDPNVQSHIDTLKSVDHSTFNRIILIIKEIIKTPIIKTATSLIKDGSAEYLDANTGLVINGMKYGDGVQQFIEIKHLGKIVSDFTLSYQAFSLNRYIRESKLLFGLSGTSGLREDLRKFQMDLWKIEDKPIILPDFRDSNLAHIDADQLKLPQDKWIEAIIANINSVKGDQPVLIITESPKIADALFTELEKANIGTDTQLRSYKSMANIHAIQNSKGDPLKLNAGDIIITTNLGGRGTDYKYNDALKKGLHVIIGYDSDEERNLLQAMGRAGRAGKPGTWIKIALGEKLEQKQDIEKIKMNVANTIVKDIIFDFFDFFKNFIKDSDDNSSMYAFKKWLSRSDIQQEFVNRIIPNPVIPYDKDDKDGKMKAHLDKVSLDIITFINDHKDMTKHITSNPRVLDDLHTKIHKHSVEVRALQRGGDYKDEMKDTMSELIESYVKEIIRMELKQFDIKDLQNLYLLHEGKVNVFNSARNHLKNIEEEARRAKEEEERIKREEQEALKQKAAAEAAAITTAITNLAGINDIEALKSGIQAARALGATNEQLQGELARLKVLDDAAKAKAAAAAAVLAAEAAAKAAKAAADAAAKAAVEDAIRKATNATTIEELTRAIQAARALGATDQQLQGELARLKGLQDAETARLAAIEAARLAAEKKRAEEQRRAEEVRRQAEEATKAAAKAAAEEALRNAKTIGELTKAIAAAEALNLNIDVTNAKSRLNAEKLLELRRVAAISNLQNAKTIFTLELAISAAKELNIDIGDAQARLDKMKKDRDDADRERRDRLAQAQKDLEAAQAAAAATPSYYGRRTRTSTNEEDAAEAARRRQKLLDEEVDPRFFRRGDPFVPRINPYDPYDPTQYTQQTLPYDPGPEPYNPPPPNPLPLPPEQYVPPAPEKPPAADQQKSIHRKTCRQPQDSVDNFLKLHRIQKVPQYGPKNAFIFNINNPQTDLAGLNLEYIASPNGLLIDTNNAIKLRQQRRRNYNTYDVDSLIDLKGYSGTLVTGLIFSDDKIPNDFIEALNFRAAGGTRGYLPMLIPIEVEGMVVLVLANDVRMVGEEVNSVNNNCFQDLISKIKPAWVTGGTRRKRVSKNPTRSKKHNSRLTKTKSIKKKNSRTTQRKYRI